MVFFFIRIPKPNNFINKNFSISLLFSFFIQCDLTSNNKRRPNSFNYKKLCRNKQNIHRSLRCSPYKQSLSITKTKNRHVDSSASRDQLLQNYSEMEAVFRQKHNNKAERQKLFSLFCKSSTAHWVLFRFWISP